MLFITRVSHRTTALFITLRGADASPLAIPIVPVLRRQEERSRRSAPQSIANGSSVGTPDQSSPLPSWRSNQYGPTTLTPVGVGLPIVNVAWNPLKKPVPLEYTQSPCPVVVAVG